MDFLSGMDLPAASDLISLSSSSLQSCLSLHPVNTNHSQGTSLVAWICHLPSLIHFQVLMGTAHYCSPSSKLRDQRRLSNYLRIKVSASLKPVKLMVSSHPSIDINPIPNIVKLSTAKTSSTNIPSHPKIENL